MPDVKIIPAPVIVPFVQGVPTQFRSRVGAMMGPTKPFGASKPCPPPPVVHVLRFLAQPDDIFVVVEVHCDHDLGTTGNTLTDPIWRITDALNNSFDVPLNTNLGLKVAMGGFEAAYNPPYTLIVPNGANQIVGINGGFVVPGSYVSE